jgi:hypothetical protein
LKSRFVGRTLFDIVKIISFLFAAKSGSSEASSYYWLDVLLNLLFFRRLEHADA